MTEPVPDRRGFEHKNVFYEFVPMDEWLHRDFTLARVLTRVGVDEVLSGRDYMAFTECAFAVAVWHQNPQEKMERIATFVDLIKPDDVKEIGFTQVAEGDAGPPDAPASSATQSDSSETGENSSESS